MGASFASKQTRIRPVQVNCPCNTLLSHSTIQGCHPLDSVYASNPHTPPSPPLYLATARAPCPPAASPCHRHMPPMRRCRTRSSKTSRQEEIFMYLSNRAHHRACRRDWLLVIICHRWSEKGDGFGVLREFVALMNVLSCTEFAV